MNHATLQQWLHQGHTFEYLMFWGHRQKRPGRRDASCLSQWFPSPFTVDGVEYATAEHWMMAGKARLFGDEAILPQILDAPDPGKVKSLGRKVRNFDEAIWTDARYALVTRGNHHKFEQHVDMRAFLLNTGRQVLVEASPSDRIWGIGLSASSPAASDPFQWRGLNLLGFALTELRATLGGASVVPTDDDR